MNRKSFSHHQDTKAPRRAVHRSSAFVLVCLRGEASRVRAAFTLVEMLVATGLVVLIMLLFAQMFTGVVGSMTQQQGIASNDGKARIIESTLRTDLDKLSFRQPKKGGVRGIVPLAPGDVVDANQRGYFYYSENDPLDDTDDVLQFTIDITTTKRAADRTPLFGRSTRLNIPDGNAANPEQEEQINGPGGNPLIPSSNQPDMDNGAVGDGTMTSRAAEVVYFLRNGNLYRRTMLLRDPLRAPVGQSIYSEQPTFIARENINDPPLVNVRYFSAETQTSGGLTFGGNVNYSSDVAPGVPRFWNDFDSSATRLVLRDSDPADPTVPDISVLHFNGYSSLENGNGLSNSPIAIPYHRFGFAPLLFSAPPALAGLNSTMAGRSREFTTTAAASPFLGRFLHEETSDPDFAFPGSLPATDWQNPTVALALDADGMVPALMGGDRAGEDLLVANVESFDVKIWDPTYSEFVVDTSGDGVPDYTEFNNDGTPQSSGLFVDVGNEYGRAFGGAIGTRWAGAYNLNNRLNPGYGPWALVAELLGPTLPTPLYNPAGEPIPDEPRNRNRVLDTWHPDYTFNFDGNADGDMADGVDITNNNPPYRPLQVSPLSAITAPRIITTDSFGAGFTVPGLPVFPNTTPDGPWAVNQRCPGQVYFPTNSNGSIGFRVIRSGETTLNPNGRLNLPVTYFDYNGDGNNDFGFSNTTEPEWQFTPGATVMENTENNDNADLTTFLDDVVWEAFDNRVGIETLQIIVRYRDQQSGLSRQVTIQHSFVE